MYDQVELPKPTFNSSTPNWGNLLGGVGSIANYFNGGSSKPYDTMHDYYGQSIDRGRGELDKANSYLDPFYQAGKGEMPSYLENMHKLMNGPDFYKNMMKDWQMSPTSQFQLGRSLEAGQQSANAGGLRGSTAARDDAMETAQGITSKDQQQYYENAMRPFQMGFGAQGGMVNSGQQAGSQMSGNTMSFMQQLMQAIQNQGLAKGASEQGESNDFGSMLGGIGSIASMLGRGANPFSLAALGPGAAKYAALL
jgi:hypothetical protein